MDILLKALWPIITVAVGTVLTVERLRNNYADALFDWLKKVIRETETPIDDRVALPVVEALERAFGDPSD